MKMDLFKPNILAQELKMTLRTWLYYTLSMVILLAFFGAFFNYFKEDARLMDQLLQNFPPEFKAAFGMVDVNLAEVDGYFSFLMTYVVLIGAVFGMKQGIGLLSEESRRKTADFLLTRPVRRTSVVSGKVAAVLISLIAQNLVIFVSGLMIIRMLIGESISLRIYALLTGSVFLVQLFFVGIGLVLAATLQRIKSVMPITLGVVFFFFIIELVNESLMEKKLTYVTPFSYFKGSLLISRQHYDIVYLLVDLAVFASLTALSYWIYQKKDIHAV